LAGVDRHAAARAALHEALAMDPDLTDAHVVLGVVHMNEGDYHAARTAFEHALALDPTQAVAQSHLATIDAVLAEENSP
jgi:lipoprotein NlpI